MPFVLVLIGLAVVISAARGTHGDLGALLKKDFTGSNNFLVWLFAIMIVGIIGYYGKAQTFSRAFLALILLAMVLANGGVFTKLVEALGGSTDGGSAGAGSGGNTLDGKAAVVSGGGGQTSLASGPGDDDLGVAESKSVDHIAKTMAGMGLPNSIVKEAATGLAGIKSAGGTFGDIVKAAPVVGDVFGKLGGLFGR